MPTIGKATLARALAVVTQVPSCNMELHEASGMSRSTMHAALGMLVDKGLVERVKAHKPPSNGRTLWLRPLYYLPGSYVDGFLCKWRTAHSMYSEEMDLLSHLEEVRRSRQAKIGADVDKEQVYTEAELRIQKAREHKWAQEVPGTRRMSSDYLRRCRELSLQRRRAHG